MIRKVRLINFKCFADRALDVAPLTLLTGVNGTGKSSVVQALLVLRQSFDQGLLSESRLALNGDFVQLGRATDVLFEDADHEEIALTLHADAWEQYELRVAYENGAEVLSGIAGFAPPINISDEALFNNNFRYVSAERLGPRSSFVLSEQALRHMNVGVRGEFAAQLLAERGDSKLTVPPLHHPNAASFTLRDEVEAWLSHVSPGARIEATSHPAIDAVQLAFRFARRDAVSLAFRPTNVGFGLTYILPVLVSLLSAPRGSLVIIENPEAHLHPKGQALMGSMIALAAAGGVQVVCETHSDHVLNGVRVAVARSLVAANEVAVHFFARSDTDGRHEALSPRITADGSLDKWPLDFFDQWDRSLEELLVLSEV